jgi:hypothetical protein
VSSAKTIRLPAKPGNPVPPLHSAWAGGASSKKASNIPAATLDPVPRMGRRPFDVEHSL